MAISGAAINPHTGAAGVGPTRGRLTSAVLAATNIRLGVWLKSPMPLPSSDQDERTWPKKIADSVYRGIFRRTTLLPLTIWQLWPTFGYTEGEPLLELTDGGHFDNTGMYELLRRQVDTIIAVDAGMDPECAFVDLANVMERARLDFGIQVRFRAELRPEGISPKVESVRAGGPAKRLAFSERPFAVATIVIKPCLLQDLPMDILSYAMSSPQFPHTSTANQFFDESKFDAYRQLGYYLGKKTLIDLFGDDELSSRFYTTRDVTELKEQPWSYAWRDVGRTGMEEGRLSTGRDD
jgi:hypothetical protein